VTTVEVLLSAGDPVTAEATALAELRRTRVPRCDSAAAAGGPVDVRAGADPIKHEARFRLRRLLAR
jgi:hypothetical protein